MRGNVRKIGIERGGHQGKYIHVWVTTDDGDRKFFVLSEDEAHVICADKWPPYTPAFADGTHFVSFYSDTIVITQPDDREPWKHLCMPVKEAFIPHLRQVVEGFKSNVEIDEAKMYYYKHYFRPMHKVVYRNDSVRDLILSNLDAPTGEKMTLKDLVLSLVRIARNNSNGECVLINISQNGWGNMRGSQGESPYERPSFYWSINRLDGSRIMNGGIIWHGPDWGYSVHT